MIVNHAEHEGREKREKCFLDQCVAPPSQLSALRNCVVFSFSPAPHMQRRCSHSGSLLSEREIERTEKKNSIVFQGRIFGYYISPVTNVPPFLPLFLLLCVASCRDAPTTAIYKETLPTWEANAAHDPHAAAHPPMVSLCHTLPPFYFLFISFFLFGTVAVDVEQIKSC